MNNKIVMKVMNVSNEILLSAADTEIVGMNLRQGNLHLEVKEDFYGTSRVSKALFLEAMNICTIANLVGNYTVRVAIEAKFVNADNVIEIQGIKHCQYARLIRS
ncbi:MAG: DUF424 domain-containing protein [Thermoplasmataceae archaeon]